MKVPIYGNIKFMFQTTNQSTSFNHKLEHQLGSKITSLLPNAHLQNNMWPNSTCATIVYTRVFISIPEPPEPKNWLSNTPLLKVSWLNWKFRGWIESFMVESTKNISLTPEKASLNPQKQLLFLMVEAWNTRYSVCRRDAYPAEAPDLQNALGLKFGLHQWENIEKTCDLMPI